jgi:polyisoprenoid-binding protein YceI
MKKLFILMVLGLSQIALFGQTKWSIDAVHSSVKFTVNHLVISEVEGNFKKFTGSISSDKPDFEGSAVDFSVDVNSISTDNDMRDKHLKSPDFFDVEKFPSMTFKGTSFKKLSGNKYELAGDLTMHGVTKPVKFSVTYGGTINDGMGNTKAGFKATAVIDRFDYGLKWSKATEAGGLVVGKEVTIDVKLELVKAK